MNKSCVEIIVFLLEVNISVNSVKSLCYYLSEVNTTYLLATERTTKETLLTPSEQQSLGEILDVRSHAQTKVP